MNKKYAVYILFGIVIGAFFGTAFGPAIDNVSLATALGAFGGLFIGWFITAAMRENKTRILVEHVIGRLKKFRVVSDLSQS